MTQDQYYALFPSVEEAMAHEAFILESQMPFPDDADYYDFLAAEHVRLNTLRMGASNEFRPVGHDGRRREAIRREAALAGPVRFFSPTEPVTKPCAVNFEMDVEGRRLEFDCGEHITTCVAILIAKAVRLDQAWSTTINMVEIIATPSSNLQRLVAGYRRALATKSPKAEEQDP